MPIRPERRDLYPADWKEISRRIRFERAEGRCECEGECGVNHHGRCHHEHGWLMAETYAICVLTVAHLDHDETNNAEENLKAMCQGCHNRYDAPHRRAGIAARRLEEIERTQTSLDLEWG